MNSLPEKKSTNSENTTSFELQADPSEQPTPHLTNTADEKITVFSGEVSNHSLPVKKMELPERIGRFRLLKAIGQGGFGRVFLAVDDELNRHVAIKIPISEVLTRSNKIERFVVEARSVAMLDHPNIVTVYDIGSTNEIPIYIVSKFIDGVNLEQRIKSTPMSMLESASLIATIAEALHYAHKKGLVHRDVKPSNILIDKSGNPFVVDFGLALSEIDFCEGYETAGTPAYMSPEQARGEGHRVDGRSDVFSLGVVFYELLVGRKPFKLNSYKDLRELIGTTEPRPPRQLNENVPRELDRICLKALAKRASDRYSTANDMAEDLRFFLNQSPPPTSAIASLSSPQSNVAVQSDTVTPSGASALKIIPKGLRSFDAHDADFFLELLPGPRDRQGLPDSLRFWKTRIEEMDGDKTFAVGLMYGPSGCGKSSLIKAGLLPRLEKHVIPVYVEAAGEETETRIRSGLRKSCPELSPNLSLKESLTALRRGEGKSKREKLLIVIDQFEQWLHAKQDESTPELAEALRQCDGCNVQCIVLVRDEFWLAVSRFMRLLENRLVEGHNSALVDLFDQGHAKKVLTTFGQSFGKLPEKTCELSAEHLTFIKQAVENLSESGKVVCVRLALFAEMMKSKEWTTQSLSAVGGTHGLGVSFLQETFSAATAPPEHRLRQNAAKAILQSLLPETGMDIKGNMKSRAELKVASGYTRDVDFDIVMQILENEVRLVTPTDPEGANLVDSNPQFSSSAKFHQLTHDFLVPALRQWLEADNGIFSRISKWCHQPERIILSGTSFVIAGSVIAIWETQGLISILLGLDLVGVSTPVNRPIAAAWFSIFLVSAIVGIFIGIQTIRRSLPAMYCGFVLTGIYTVWEIAVLGGHLTFTMGGVLANRDSLQMIHNVLFWVSASLWFFNVTAIMAFHREKQKRLGIQSTA